MDMKGKKEGKLRDEEKEKSVGLVKEKKMEVTE